MHRSITSLAILLVTIPTGLAIRLLPLHLPWLLYKYGGSVLWAVGLYQFLAAMLPRLRPTALATIATIISILLELSRLIPIAPFYLAAFSLESGAKLITFDKAVGAKTKDSIVLALP